MARTAPRSDSERLGKLIDLKLSDLEARTKRGEVPDVKELNAVRRLVDWRDREKVLSQAREITKG